MFERELNINSAKNVNQTSSNLESLLENTKICFLFDELANAPNVSF